MNAPVQLTPAHRPLVDREIRMLAYVAAHSGWWTCTGQRGHGRDRETSQATCAHSLAWRGLAEVRVVDTRTEIRANHWGQKLAESRNIKCPCTACGGTESETC